MASGPTYYDFFGVSRTASADEIRSAYLWLMKQYHPDLTDGAERKRAADYAAILNRSYDVLKDPQKRANYDAWLDLGAKGRGKARVRRALLTGETRRKQTRGWDSTSKGAAALAGAILLLLVTAVAIPVLRPQAVPAASTLASSAPHLDDDGVRREVRLAMNTRPDDAQAASERCFAEARTEVSAARIEACIVFDDAYLEWNQSAAEILSRPTYFNDAVVRVRHRDALAVAGSFPDARMMQLRQQTLNALLGEISRKVSKDAATR